MLNRILPVKKSSIVRETLRTIHAAKCTKPTMTVLSTHTVKTKGITTDTFAHFILLKDLLREIILIPSEKSYIPDKFSLLLHGNLKDLHLQIIFNKRLNKKLNIQRSILHI